MCPDVCPRVRALLDVGERILRSISRNRAARVDAIERWIREADTLCAGRPKAAKKTVAGLAMRGTP
jgi:hypothetical protein